MYRRTAVLAITLAGLLLSTLPASAENLGGTHYSLNIIGVDNPKTSPMTNSDRHTIFVGLGKRGQGVTTNIYLQPGYDFHVCDGNGFDAAYDCSGAQLKGSGATFQLPCNTYNTYTEGFGCPDDVAQRSYIVYARALGKPGGRADVMTCATETTDLDGDGKLDQVCATENVLTLKRGTGKSVWQDATSELTTLVADIDGDGDLETISLFADGFEDFLWQYGNQGLRLAQIRFYPVIQ